LILDPAREDSPGGPGESSSFRFRGIPIASEYRLKVFRISRQAPLLLLFFFSGACGLLYELIWIRMAGTVIGNTTHAVGTVVGVYMAGLALGARLGGRAADRRSGLSLLRLYGLLELGVALSALLVPLLLRLGEPFVGALWKMTEEAAPLYAVARIILIGITLLVPTTLMGATLPVLSRFLTGTEGELAGEAGRAYAINTFGGVAGTLAGGFWLIPSFGLWITLLSAVAINFTVAALAIRMGRRESAALPPPPTRAPTLPTGAVAVAAFSGFTSLLYEVAWSRSLVLSLGSSVQALTLILSSFILGLALGSAIASRVAVKAKNPVLPLAGIQLAVGIVAILLIPFLGSLPVRVANLVDSSGDSFHALLAGEFFLISAVLLVPAMLLGAIFPVVCRYAGGSAEAAGRTVGAVYSWNTVGSIAGTVLGSFVLAPLLGLSATIRLAATVNFALAAGLLALSRTGYRPASVMPLVGVLVLWLLPSWNPGVLSSGSYLYGRTYVQGARATAVSLDRFVGDFSPPLAEYWDAYGLVSVHQQGPVLSLRVNGKVDASTGELDSQTQLYVGHLPLLHHPAPKQVLVIGLGGGFTLGAATRHPEVERIDCVEISSAVVRGASHFADVSGHPLEDPRVHLHIGDGRTLVRFSRDFYDVIISEPSNLWVSGMANLFTREFFEEGRRRLAPGGCFCQWIYASGLEVRDFKQVLRTFYSVFREGSLWEVQPGSDYLLLGGERLARPDYRMLDARLLSSASLRKDLEEPGLPGALGLVGHLVTDAEEARAIAGPGALITDDLPSIEFTAPRSLHRETRVDTLSLLDHFRAEPVETTHFAGLDADLARKIARRREDRHLFARSVKAYWQGSYDLTFQLLEEAGRELGRDRQMLSFREDVMKSLVTQASQSLAAGDSDGALEKMKRIPRSSAQWGAAQLEMAKVYRAGSRNELARHAYRDALTDARSAFDACIGLASLAEEEGHLTEATVVWREAVRLRPDLVPARVRLASSLVQEGRLQEARQVVEEALRIDPKDSNAHQLWEALNRR
jgi:spermidine synthase